MSTQKSGCLMIVLILLLCLSLFFNFAFLAYNAARLGKSPIMARTDVPRFEEKTLIAGTRGTSDKIVVLPLHGVISGMSEGDLGESMVEDLSLALRQATEDPEVKAIVLNIDSPGGEVTASDVMYQAVRRAREKKPVVVYMGSLAASGGYYISCGGSWLMANETTITGSIGVIIQTLNYRQLFGKIGLESVVFKSGKLKDMLNGSREMTPEEKEYIQSLVMQTYDKFVGIVAAERKIPVEELKAGIADGRIISGKDAAQFKLINGLGLIEDAYEKARELGRAPGAAVIKYEAAFKLGRLFRMLGEAKSTKVEISVADRLLPKLEAGKLYFLPSFYFP